MSHVAENREKRGIKGGIATDKVGALGQKTSQFKDAQAAAAEAVGAPDVTGNSEHFYLDYSGERKPDWAVGKKTTTYGPFTNASGGGDVPKGDVRIVIVHPEKKK